jgi:hypothetical protein
MEKNCVVPPKKSFFLLDVLEKKSRIQFKNDGIAGHPAVSG